MGEKSWILYGATGYTGRLIAAAAVQAGMQPILAGRNSTLLEPMAAALDLPWRAFSLEHMPSVLAGIQDADAVLHCAGPFSVTSAPMLQACLNSGTHYLDITGEIDVFEAVFASHDKALQADITLLPGVGFDVVPTDCLATMLKQRLPSATSLELAFGGGASMSRGTLKTSLEGVPKGLRVRRHGQLHTIPWGSLEKTVRFADKPRLVVAIPWGDVSTAYRSTNIPNIVCYKAMSPKEARRVKSLRPMASLLRASLMQRAAKKLIDWQPPGPSQQELEHGRTHVWGRVWFDRKTGGTESLEGTLELGDGYAFTAQAAIESMRRMLAGGVQKGALTPALAFGPEFVMQFKDVQVSIEAPLASTNSAPQISPA